VYFFLIIIFIIYFRNLIFATPHRTYKKIKKMIKKRERKKKTRIIGEAAPAISKAEISSSRVTYRNFSSH